MPSAAEIMQHRTDGSDALSHRVITSKVFNDFQFDTLYIGCEKFPYRDTFSLSMSGIL